MPVLHNLVSNKELKARMLAETEPRTITECFGIGNLEIFIKRDSGARLGFSQHARLQLFIGNEVM